ncbi:MAG: helix-turn-helix domain-containing protein [Treponema sp.]|jgi:transcriptional regulator with XRE-family HTH domain|nr:helix-turn-helix domain-containing protein [Treponema sp.]
MKETNEIGSRFRQVRKNLKLSQKMLAERICVSQCVISEIERGTRMPSQNVMVLLCLKGYCEIGWLLTGKSKIADMEKIISEKNIEISALKKRITDLEIKIRELNRTTTQTVADNIPDFNIYRARSSIENMSPQKLRAAASTSILKINLFDNQDVFGIIASYLHTKQKRVFLVFQTELDIENIFKSLNVKFEMRNGGTIENNFPFTFRKDSENQKYEVEIDVSSYQPQLIGSDICFKAESP